MLFSSILYIVNLLAFAFYRLGPPNAFGPHPKYPGNQRLKRLTEVMLFILFIALLMLRDDSEKFDLVYIFVCNFAGVFVILFVLKDLYTEWDPKFWKRERYQSGMYSFYTTIWYTFTKYKMKLTRYLFLYLIVWPFIYVLEPKHTKGIPMLVRLEASWEYILVWLLYSFFPITAGTLAIYNILRKK